MAVSEQLLKTNAAFTCSDVLEKKKELLDLKKKSRNAIEKFNLYLSGLNTSNGNAINFTVD